MKRRLLFMLFFLSFFAEVLYAAPPTTPSANLTYTNVEGNAMFLNWTRGNGASRIVIAKAGSAVTAVPVNGTNYLASNNFGSGTQIAPGEYVVYNGSSYAFTLSALSPATTYYFAIFEYNGTGSAIEYLTGTFLAGNKSTIMAPTTQSSAINISGITGNSANISWTKGNGDYRLMLVKKGTPADANPVDLTSYYTHSWFGSGTQIGTGNYASYKDAGNTVTLNNLKANSTYHLKLFEFNGYSAPVYATAGAPVYSFTTAVRPSMAATGFTVTTSDGNIMDLGWKIGNGKGRIIVIKQGSPVTGLPADGVSYTASNTFGAGSQIAPGEFVVMDNNSNAASTRIYGLSHSTTYHFAIFEYDLADSGPMYLTTSFAVTNGTTVSPPTIPAAALTVSNISNNSMKLTWINGNGANRLVVAKAGGPANATPVNYISYFANTNFTYGSNIGDNTYVVYYGPANTTNVTNLTGSTTYHYAVYEANGTSGISYLTTSPATTSATTHSRPTVAASSPGFSNVEGNSMRLAWTNGNGSNRIVIARKSSSVSATPADATTYTANAAFGNGTEIAPGEFVVYNGPNNWMDLTNLEPSTTYFFAIFESAGIGANIQYLTTSFSTGIMATLSPPTTAANNFAFNSITNNSMTLTWMNGNGSKRIVIAKAGSPVDADATTGINYAANSSFGAGASLGSGNYVVYISSGNTVNLINLQPAITYYFKVVEANGNTWPLYLNASVLSGSMLTTGVLPVTWIDFNAAVQDAGVQLQWKTSSETANLLFEIERSADGVTFQKSGSVAGAFTTTATHSYQFLDAAPFTGKMHYRIRQVDRDGKFSYSKTISVTNAAKELVELLQNPVRSTLQLKCSGREAASLLITNASGVIISRAVLHPGLNTINAENWKAGYYVAQVKNKKMEKPVTLAFIKQ